MSQLASMKLDFIEKVEKKERYRDSELFEFSHQINVDD